MNLKTPKGILTNKHEEYLEKISPSFVIRYGWHFGRGKWFAETLKARSRPHYSELERRTISFFGWETVNLEFFSNSDEFVLPQQKTRPIIQGIYKKQ